MKSMKVGENSRKRRRRGRPWALVGTETVGERVEPVRLVSVWSGMVKERDVCLHLTALTGPRRALHLAVCQALPSRLPRRNRMKINRNVYVFVTLIIFCYGVLSDGHEQVGLVDNRDRSAFLCQARRRGARLPSLTRNSQSAIKSDLQNKGKVIN